MYRTLYTQNAITDKKLIRFEPNFLHTKCNTHKVKIESFCTEPFTRKMRLHINKS